MGSGASKTDSRVTQAKVKAVMQFAVNSSKTGSTGNKNVKTVPHLHISFPEIPETLLNSPKGIQDKSHLRPSLDATAEERVKTNIQRRKLAQKAKITRPRRSRGHSAIVREGNNEVFGGRLSASLVEGKEVYRKEDHFVEKTDEDHFLVRRSLQDHFLFQILPTQVIIDVVDVMTPVVVKCGDIIINQGDTKGDTFYVIASGLFDIIVDNERCVTYRHGQNFGELALMYDSPRAATVKAKTDGVLWALDRIPFRMFVTSNVEQEFQTIEETLLGVKAFQPPNVSKEGVQQLAQLLNRQHIHKNKVIINQGDKGEVFYLIETGKVSCRKDGKHTIMLGPGEYFGEQALLTKNKRAMTVVAISNCQVFTVHKTEFENFIKKYPAVVTEMNKNHDTRVCVELEALARVRRPLLDLKLQDLTTVRIIGKGAYGMVRLVRCRNTNTPYAVKVMQKARVVENQQAINVITERNIMHELDHPFLVRLEGALSDKNCLYIVTEFLGGGDLFNLLCEFDGVLESEPASFYTACIISAFSYLHKHNFIYRDLKPENIVLDSNGYIKLVDLGMAKAVYLRTYTICGTPEYMAPEIIHGTGHGRGVDYWALGIVLYEMLCGVTPFADDDNKNHLEIYKRVDTYCNLYPTHAFDSKRSLIEWPKWIFAEPIRDLVTKLLNPQVSSRLGVDSDIDIRNHTWFSESMMSIDWSSLENMEVTAPIVPCMDNDFDTQNFDDWGKEKDVTDYEPTGSHYEKLWKNSFGEIQ